MTIPPDSVPTDGPAAEREDGTAPTAVPADGVSGDSAAAPGRPARNRAAWWIAAGVVVVVAAVVAVGLLVPLPYYLIEPGSVRPAEQRIEVRGAPAFDTRGDVLFTTVFLVRATPFRWVKAQIDDAVEVVPEKVLYPDGDTRAGQQRNRLEMDLSKLLATREALEYLGYPATVTADGAAVAALVPPSPSEGRLAPGDVITSVDGDTVALPSDIGRTLADRRPGDTVPVRFRRGPAARQTEVTLGRARDGEARPVLGVQVVPANPHVDSPVTVEVDSGSVSGPSAGLAWTLAIIDRLTPGSLTSGRDVAVTGEILSDGRVGPIGGVVQKVSAVRRAGIRTFLYPAGTPAEEQRAMRRTAGDAVELRPVATLQEAVEVLAPGGVRRPR